MKKGRALHLFLAPLAVLLPLAGAVVRSAPPAREPLTVMSFNIRYGTAKDGDNAWPLRREMLFHVLRATAADLVGLQEALSFQLDEIIAAVPVYAAVGVGREDGNAAGELSAILFRKDRFRVGEAGTFWLSDAPTVAGSKSWGNDISRVCTWARFIDRDGRGLYHFNVHLDHRSQPSRERSVILLRDRIDQRAVRADPPILTGDFNASETNPAVLTLTGPAAAVPFLDTFRVLHPASATAGTFSGFIYGAVAGEKIDYVLVPPGTEVLEAEINRYSRNRRYPSDHFPVTARVRLPER